MNLFLRIFNFFLLCLILLKLFFIFYKRWCCRKKKKVFGILHPNNLGGGGGERVLWCFVKGIQEKYPNCEIYIYSSHNKDFPHIKRKVKETFNIEIEREVKVIEISFWKDLVDKMSNLPFTLLFQSLMSAIMGFVSLLKFTPHIFVETTGYAFTYPFASIFCNCKVICYTHYPTISTDMLRNVKNRVKSVNNQGSIAKSSTKTTIKILYYRLFSALYGACGYFADVVMVNSSWTKGHIDSLWFGNKNRIHRVYPPVSVEYFYKNIPLLPENREKNIVSIGQFRKEKDHFLQVDSFNLFLKQHPVFKTDSKLILIGGAFRKDHKDRVARLKKHVKELGLENNVEFVINATYQQICDNLKKGIIGLHCMNEEHFGIVVVEYQAAGLIPLAHDSAGPKMDICVDYDNFKTGYLAKTKEGYAKKMYEIFNAYFGGKEEEKKKMMSVQINAKESSKRFGENVFVERVKKLV